MSKVMIIDDSKPIRIQIKNFIDKLGFESVVAINGSDALAQLEILPNISLFIVDVNMPIIDGFEFCRILRKNSKYADTPVIMVTTENSSDMIDIARPLGVRAWILKPFENQNLKKALELLGILNKD